MASIWDSEWWDEPCFKEFLRFLIANPFLAASYRAMVQAVIMTLDQQIAEATLVIAQYTALLQIEDILLRGYDSIVRQFTSQLGVLPFNQFKECVSVSHVVDFINKNIDPYNLPLVGNIKKKLYDNERKKSYLEFLQKANQDRIKFRDDLLASLNALNNA